MNHQPSRRLRLTTSWWIACELVRRHPHLRLIETHPAGGTYDILSLRDTRADDASVCDINRNEGGTIHVLGRSEGILSWNEVLSFDDPHEAVRRVEEAARLGAPKRTPPTNRAALTYRTISRVLDTLRNDRSTWDARNGLFDTSGYGHGRRSLADFPLALAAATPRDDDMLGEAFYRFWILTRDEVNLAVLDTRANLYTPTRAVDLYDLFVQSDRSLNRVAGVVIDTVVTKASLS